MNALDYVLLVVLLLFLVNGYRRGFLWQFLSIIGIVASFFVAAYYHAPVAEWSILDGLRERNEPLALVVCFVSIFFVLAGVTAMLAAAIGRKMKKKEGVRDLDKWLGALIGTAKGVVLLGALAIGLQEWGLPQGVAVPAEHQEKAEGWIAESVLVPKFADLCLVAIEKIPREGRDEIARIYREQKRLVGLIGGEGEEGISGAAPEGTTADVPISRVREGAPEGAGAAEAAQRAVKSSEDAKRPRLLDLGALRKLVVDEREVIRKPVPASAKTGAEAPSTPEK